MADFISTLLADDTDNLYVEVIRENLENRTLIFNEEVTDDVVEKYIHYILKWNKEDMNLPVDNRKPITIVLNSPGGDVMIGFSLIDVILASKTPIRGVVIGLAASMAFHIILACDERIATQNSILLMHDGNISLSNSSSKFKDTVKFFDSMDDRTRQYVLARTNMDEDFYEKYYDSEYYMFADKAKELGCIDKIIGIDCDMDYIFS